MPTRSAGADARTGFTLLELTVVVTIAVVIVTMGSLAFSGYFQRDSARRAAQVFSRDLLAARSFAVRSQEPVVIRFYETSLWYEIESQTTATEVARRRFGTSADIDLSGVDLEATGDSVVFSVRGVADLSGFGTPVGTAQFSSGAISYTVWFNSMGASKIYEN